MVVTTRRNLITAVVFFVVVALVAAFVYTKQSERNRGIVPVRPGPQSVGGAGGAKLPPSLGTAGAADFFVDYRLERDRVRSQPRRRRYRPGIRRFDSDLPSRIR